MTVERGAPWGARTVRPPGLRTVEGDRELALAFDDGSEVPTGARSGDMLRTLGVQARARPEDGLVDGAVGGLGGPDVLAVPIDLVRVQLDGVAAGLVVAHLVIRAAHRRGGLLRGPVVLVMNAEFIGDWDVAPRGHPNDGRIEVVSFAPGMPLRQRLAARRKLCSASHMPHPDISSRSVAEASWAFDRPMTVIADGHRLGTARSVEITVLPDAATLHV
ncbi:MAG: hypothetical protein QNM02_06165 [Acidimicrobiia bacterium]|nr:hypothetical protein [Acidimicrobiia bacterium]